MNLLVDGTVVATDTFTSPVYDGTAPVLLGEGLDGTLDEVRLSESDESGSLFSVTTTTVGNENASTRSFQSMRQQNEAQPSRELAGAGVEEGASESLRSKR